MKRENAKVGEGGGQAGISSTDVVVTRKRIKCHWSIRAYSRYSPTQTNTRLLTKHGLRTSAVLGTGRSKGE